MAKVKTQYQRIVELEKRIEEMETVFLTVIGLIVDVIPHAYAEDIDAVINEFHEAGE